MSEQITVTLSDERAATIREYAERQGKSVEEVASRLLEVGSRMELAGWTDRLLAGR